MKHLGRMTEKPFSSYAPFVLLNFTKLDILQVMKKSYKSTVRSVGLKSTTTKTQDHYIQPSTHSGYYKMSKVNTKPILRARIHYKPVITTIMYYRTATILSLLLGLRYMIQLCCTSLVAKISMKQI